VCVQVAFVHLEDFISSADIRERGWACVEFLVCRRSSKPPPRISSSVPVEAHGSLLQNALEAGSKGELKSESFKSENSTLPHSKWGSLELRSHSTLELDRAAEAERELGLMFANALEISDSSMSEEET
jgi:hypothetical protein